MHYMLFMMLICIAEIEMSLNGNSDKTHPTECTRKSNDTSNYIYMYISSLFTAIHYSLLDKDLSSTLSMFCAALIHLTPHYIFLILFTYLPCDISFTLLQSLV